MKEESVISREEQLSALQKSIAYEFLDMELLNTALTHTSFVKGDGKGPVHNERLEYLGDAVLELCITEQLYKRCPTWSEGAMTRARAAIVCEQSLYEAAKRMNLAAFLRLGHGEEMTGGRDKPSILSDALEALTGAIYMDGGFACARAFVLLFAGDMLEKTVKGKAKKDYKSTLQELVQKKHIGKLNYRLASSSGPDHKKEFHMQAYLDGVVLGEGCGNSKQEAGQKAAQQALESLQVRDRGKEEGDRE